MNGDMPTARQRPWLMRTYAGHSSVDVSNRLFRDNMARGQTGLSIAFDLPTQTGYDSDHEAALGEVGKVGVPVCHLGDLDRLLDGIPLEAMNTSMTINATAPWLLALYAALADSRGIDRASLTGTVQNDLIKEFLARGTYIFPPAPSHRLSADIVAFTLGEIPRWNPTNICSYHLQEAGATPVQEVAFALANAIALLDAVRERGDLTVDRFAAVVGRVSFFVNAGMRLVTEICKLRAFAHLWDEITRDRYGVDNAKFRRFRYGVQVNSLGLTEQQPENNVYRILIEMLAVVLSKDARARAIQLPAWNEALGLPRPWDQQWSLRAQQIVAFETDLLEFDDIFTGSEVVEAETTRIADEARAEVAAIEAMGGALAAVESGYMKQALVVSNARRIAAIETGERTVVGVNAYQDGVPSPLADDASAFQQVDEAATADHLARLAAWRENRDDGAVRHTLELLGQAARDGANIMGPSIACAKAGATTGEWADALRAVFGEYRAPTGVASAPSAGATSERFAEVRAAVGALTERLGRPPRILLGKPGLDGHSNGAEQIAVRARDCGFEVIYDGIRRTSEQIVEAAVQEDVDLVGLSVLSGGHLGLARDILDRLRAADAADIPVVVGGIIPAADAVLLTAAGVARVFTPKDYDLTLVIADLVALVEARAATA
jgi:(2R)-ethylmalonyl-CoA mutase